MLASNGVHSKCATIQDETERKACCDGIESLKSAAGRDFCYHDIIHAEGTFQTCLDMDATDYQAVFDCCEDHAKGNKNIAFDCEQEVLQGQCFSVEECISKPAQPKDKASSDSADDVDSSVDGMMVANLINVSILAIAIIALIIWACKTKCGKKPFR